MADSDSRAVTRRGGASRRPRAPMGEEPARVRADPAGPPAVRAARHDAGLIAFVAFCLAASGGYVLNDLWISRPTGCHPTKRHRPFASATLPLAVGMVLAPLLLVAVGRRRGASLPREFLVLLLLYIVMTAAYSSYLKRIAVLDVLLLAGLYTLRVLAGVGRVRGSLLHLAAGLRHVPVPEPGLPQAARGALALAPDQPVQPAASRLPAGRRRVAGHHGRRPAATSRCWCWRCISTAMRS